MAENKATINLTIQSAIRYQDINDPVSPSKSSNIITIKEPTVRQRAIAAGIKQQVNTAIFGMLDKLKATSSQDGNDNQSSPDKSSGKDYIELLSMAKDIDMEKLYNDAITLLTNGCGFVDKVALTSSMIEQISLSDFNEIVGTFIKNFLALAR